MALELALPRTHFLATISKVLTTLARLLSLEMVIQNYLPSKWPLVGGQLCIVGYCSLKWYSKDT
jgi:hypothetical protein